MQRYRDGNKSSDKYTADPSKYPQGYFKDKPCRRCAKVFSPIAPSHLFCSDKCKTDQYATRHLDRNYGITVDDWDRMYAEQKGKCAICRQEGFEMKPGYAKLNVDHCHETGEVRGLLCHNCNRGLGLFQDNKELLSRAIDYLDT